MVPLTSPVRLGFSRIRSPPYVTVARLPGGRMPGGAKTTCAPDQSDGDVVDGMVDGVGAAVVPSDALLAGVELVAAVAEP